MIACVLSLALISGCSAKDDSKTLQFWAPFTGPDGKNMQKIVDDFNTMHKGEYEVKMQLIPMGDMYGKYQTALSSSKGLPDVMAVHIERVVQYQKADALKPITESIANIGIDGNDYIESVWKATEIDGERYALPLDVHPFYLYYNTDMLEKMGYTEKDVQNISYEKYLKLASEVKPKLGEDSYGIAMWENADWIGGKLFYSGLLQRGLPTIDKKNPTKAAYNTPGADELLTNLMEMKPYATPDGVAGTDLFYGGKVLFLTEGPWMQNAVSEVGDTMNWGMTSIPQMGEHKGVWAGSHNLVVDAKMNPEKSELSEKFLKHISDSGLEWAKAGQIPANKAIHKDKEFLALKWSSMASEENLKAIKFDDLTTTKEDLLGPVGVQIGLLWTGEVATAKEALDAAAKEGEEMVSQATN